LVNRPLHDLDDPTNFDCWPQGCEWLRARTAPAGPGMPAWFTGNVIALCAVYFLDIVALIAGLVRA
jgi:hypothetical protein